MSIWKNGKLVAGGRQCMPLLSFMWADHRFNDASWLRADTFSWQRGAIYRAAYAHLADDYEDIVSTTTLTYNQNGNVTNPIQRNPSGDSSGFFKWGESFYTAAKNPSVGDVGFIVNDMYVGITVATVSGDDITLSSGSPQTFTRDSSYDKSGIYYWVYTYPDTPQYHLYVVSTKPTLDVGDEVILIPGNGWDHYPVVSVVRTGTATEVVGGVTIEYAVAEDGHKIVASDQEMAVLNIYNATGVAWYYIIDTANKRFKLPRTKFGFTGLRTGVGGFTDAGLPDITGRINNNSFVGSPTGSGALGVSSYTNNNLTNTSGTGDGYGALVFKASNSNSIYGNSDTVQPKSTEMYLYFYVGNFTQTALENTAGLNTELFDGKLDQDFSNATASAASALNNVGVRTVVETYINGDDWYRKYSDGWVEQGCNTHNRTSSATWNFLIPMPGPYNVQITARGSQRYAFVTGTYTGYLTFNAADDSSQNNDGLYYIKVCGYAAS